ncbi:hypothetical protein BGI41_01805 [Methanobrevibacter sp. 87.7]|uniref:hypothetical protein n=1 Tax=Methanobrevibacter sp. 87.7 TaxID=387957 RepID=UPI000B509B61|nr:hypothetical protein [Methanobrevibacter sp. 87.7]OWT33554.1 hypothetical protein BGI41_01805 [Methanobrevibacter sp. 87.7]
MKNSKDESYEDSINNLKKIMKTVKKTSQDDSNNEKHKVFKSSDNLNSNNLNEYKHKEDKSSIVNIFNKVNKNLEDDTEENDYIETKEPIKPFKNVSIKRSVDNKDLKDDSLDVSKSIILGKDKSNEDEDKLSFDKIEIKEDNDKIDSSETENEDSSFEGNILNNVDDVFIDNLDEINREDSKPEENSDDLDDNTEKSIDDDLEDNEIIDSELDKLGLKSIDDESSEKSGIHFRKDKIGPFPIAGIIVGIITIFLGFFLVFRRSARVVDSVASGESTGLAFLLFIVGFICFVFSFMQILSFGSSNVTINKIKSLDSNDDNENVDNFLKRFSSIENDIKDNEEDDLEDKSFALENNEENYNLTKKSFDEKVAKSSDDFKITVNTSITKEDSKKDDSSSKDNEED